MFSLRLNPGEQIVGRVQEHVVRVDSVGHVAKYHVEDAWIEGVSHSHSSPRLNQHRPH